MRYFISAERKELPFNRNAYRTVDLLNRIEDRFSLLTEVRQAEGCYFGTNEISYEVKARSTYELAYLKFLAFNRYQQESILQVDGENRATLIYHDGTTESVGRWTRTSEVIAKQQDCWTRINGMYFITV